MLQRRRDLALRIGAALLAGLFFALSLPPVFGWFLAPIGAAVLYLICDVNSRGQRLIIGWTAGLMQFVVGVWWMREFSIPGFAIVLLGESLALGVCTLLTPPTRQVSGWWQRPTSFVGSFVLVEAVRCSLPWGGVPLAGLWLGQVGGAFAPAARIGGWLILQLCVALLGVAIASAWGALRRRGHAGVGAIAVIGLLVVSLAGVIVTPNPGQPIAVGVVQGGGPTGTRAIESSSEEVFDRQLQATEQLVPGLEFVLWPENTVDSDDTFATSRLADDLGDLAIELDTNLIVGITEPAGEDGFYNASVVLGPDGEIVDRYDKVHRVPFGEFIPFRSIVDYFADLSVVPTDAVPGNEPGTIGLADGTELGIVISFEVFFGRRGRSGIAEGGRLLVVPTNSASYTTGQVPAQTLAAARLQAIQLGRWTVQASTTGYGALITPTGEVRAKTELRELTTITGEVQLLSSRTPYVVLGDWPMWILAIALLGARFIPIATRSARRSTKAVGA